MDPGSMKGNAEKLTGSAKQRAGGVSVNHSLKAEGARDRMTGEIRETSGTAKQTGRDIVQGAREGNAQSPRARHP